MQQFFAPPNSTLHTGQASWGHTLFQALALLGLGLGGVAAVSLDD